MSVEMNFCRSEIQMSLGTTAPDTNVNAGSGEYFRREEPGGRWILGVGRLSMLLICMATPRYTS